LVTGKSGVWLGSHTGFLIATWVAAIFGGIGIAAAFISAIVGYQLTEGALTDANERISVAREEARAEGEKAQAEIAKANAQIEVAKRDAENARLEQERLKARLAWRVLTPETIEKLKASLAGNRGRVNILHTANDPEAQYFAVQLANVFHAANWEVGLSSHTIGGVMVFGLIAPDTGTASTPLLRSSLAAAEIGFSRPQSHPQEGRALA
jgi:hypothetical protein